MVYLDADILSLPFSLALHFVEKSWLYFAVWFAGYLVRFLVHRYIPDRNVKDLRKRVTRLEEINRLTGKPMAKLIVNPGHDLHYPGARGEYEFAKQIVEALKKYVDFEYVPDDMGGVDANDNLIRTVNWVNQRFNSQDTYLAIHCNAGGGDGVEVWYFGGDPTSASEAGLFSQYLAQASGERDRGAKADTDNRWGRLAEVRDTTPWAWLAECGFVDSSDGDDILLEKADMYAKGIAKFAEHRGFALKNTSSQAAPVTTPPAPQPVPVVPVVDSSETVVIESPFGVNVRTVPDARVEVLPKGTTLKVIRRINVDGRNWLQFDRGYVVESATKKVNQVNVSVN